MEYKGQPGNGISLVKPRDSVCRSGAPTVCLLTGANFTEGTRQVALLTTWPEFSFVHVIHTVTADAVHGYIELLFYANGMT